MNSAIWSAPSGQRNFHAITRDYDEQDGTWGGAATVVPRRYVRVAARPGRIAAAHMILAFEMCWTGTVHAPGNSATLQTISLAWPDQQIRMFADASHITELQRDATLMAMPQISLHPVAVYPRFRGQASIVSVGRFRQELQIMRQALAGVPRGEPCLIVLLSANSTAIFAAAMLARTTRRRVMVQVGLHGDLNQIDAWRTRNPVLRAFDMRAALERRWQPGLRFLVLEQAIKDELAKLLPQAADRADVLKLPINTTEMPAKPTVALRYPVHFGFVGQATEAKGIGSFLALARDMRARHGDKVEFHLVGRVYPGSAMPDVSVLAEPASTDYLSRAEFVRRMAMLHYVILPFQGGYYRLAASGALIDAVTWLKPVIARRVPIVEQMFEEFGDIGHLCDDDAGIREVLDGILSNLDEARYARQVAAVAEARAARTTDRVAHDYRAMTEAQFPGLHSG
jgi:hypothetical protein